MQKLTLYHGSPNIVEHPVFGKGKVYNDYGRGFYCSEHLALAKEWACSEGVDGYANRYEIEIDAFNILDLTSNKYTILNWLAILLENRYVRLSSPIEKQGKEYLLKNFLPKYEQCDIIIGYRADDSYFSFARSFVSNGISLKQLSYAMKLGKLGEQIVLKSERAFDAIHFLDYTVADNSVYYAKRKVRDNEARKAFQKMLESDVPKGIYIRDIIREEMKSDDVRLR